MGGTEEEEGGCWAWSSGESPGWQQQCGGPAEKPSLKSAKEEGGWRETEDWGPSLGPLTSRGEGEMEEEAEKGLRRGSQEVGGNQNILPASKEGIEEAGRVTASVLLWDQKDKG